MTALAGPRSNCKRQTRPLVRESAPHQQTRNCLTVADGCFIPRQTGRLTVGRNIRLRLKLAAEAGEQFGNPEERERPPLEAATEQLPMKTQKTLRVL
jgi:hypothetical protein